MKLIEFNDGAQFRLGLLAKSGTKHSHIVVLDAAGVYVLKRPVEDEVAYYYHAEAYNATAAARFLEIGSRLGITEEAKQLLMA